MTTEPMIDLPFESLYLSSILNAFPRQGSAVRFSLSQEES
jgi:hypothetical protein